MRTENSKKSTTPRNIKAEDKVLQDTLMRELAERKASLEKLPLGAATGKAHPVSALSPGGTLRECVEHTLRNYFDHLDGQPVSRIYDMVLGEVEAPLLAVVMQHVHHNQCRAAELLGLSRGTLRKKLMQHGLL
jgi:Fis family transcriptional regulator